MSQIMRPRNEASLSPFLELDNLRFHPPCGKLQLAVFDAGKASNLAGRVADGDDDTAAVEASRSIADAELHRVGLADTQFGDLQRVLEPCGVLLWVERSLRLRRFGGAGLAFRRPSCRSCWRCWNLAGGVSRLETFLKRERGLVHADAVDMGIEGNTVAANFRRMATE